MGGVTGLGAGGSGHDSLVAVTQIGDNLGIAVAAGAGVDRFTIGGAGSIGGDGSIAVAQSGNLVGGVGIAANTGVGGVTGFGTGGSGHDSLVAVAQGCGFAVGVDITASGAGMGGVTGLGAGGSGHDSLIAVTQGGDGLGVGIATGAGVDDGTVGITGSIGGDGSIAMAQSGNLVGGVGITAGAGVGGVAGFGASGSSHNSLIAMANGGAAGGAVAIGVMAVMGAGNGLVAQGQGIIAIVHQGEGDFHTAGDVQQLTVGQNQVVIEDGGGDLALIAIGQIPVLAVAGLQADVAVLPEGHDQLALLKFVGALAQDVSAPGAVSAINGAAEVVGHHRLLHAAVGADVILIGMGTDGGTDGAAAVFPDMGTGHGTVGTDTILPAMLAGHGADGASAVDPIVGADHAAGVTVAAVPAMGTGHGADGADTIAVNMGAGLAAGAGAVHIGMLHFGTAEGADAGLVVVCMGAIGGDIAQNVGIVPVVHQGEGDDLAAGDEELVLAHDGFGVIQGGRSNFTQIAQGHVPVQIVGGLDTHIAVHGEEHLQLAVLELVDAQVGAVGLVGVVHAVDPAEEVVIVDGLLVAADGADVILQGVGHGLAAGGADAIGIMADMGTGGLVAQGVGIVAVVHQGEGDLLAAGNIELIGVGQGGGVVQHRGIDLALPAGGHVPVGIVGSLHRHIAVGGEADDDLAVHEFVLAQVGVVLLAGVVGAVDVAEEVEFIGGLGLAADGAGEILINVVAILAADGADAVHHLVGALQAAGAVAAFAVAMLNGIAADGAVAIGGVAGVVAFHSHIAELVSIVAVVNQGEGDLGAAGDEELISGGELGSVVQSDRGNEALPAIGHVVGNIVGALDANVAILGEEDRQLAVYEFVFAQVRRIFLASIISAIDIAKQIIIQNGLFVAAGGADVVLKAMVAGRAADGADAVLVKHVRAQLALNGPVEGLSFYLPGGGGGGGIVGPVGEVRPALVGKLLLIVGVALGINSLIPPPAGVGASRGVGALIAAVAGIVLGVGKGIAVESVEIVIIAGIFRHGVCITGMAPVEIDVTGGLITVDDPLSGVSGDRLHLVGLVVVLAVQAVAGGEAGGPAVDILDRSGAGLDPCVTDLSPAIQRGLVGGLGLVVGVTVLGLGFNEAFVYALGLGGAPGGLGGLGVFLIGVAAKGAGVADLFIVQAGSADDLLGVAVAGHGDGLLVDIATGAAGVDLQTRLNAGGFLVNRLGIAVGAGGLIHTGGEHHEALLQHINLASTCHHGVTIGMAAGVIGRDGIGVVAQRYGVEKGIIIDIAIDQRVIVIGNGIAGAGDDIPIHTEAAVDIDCGGGQGIIGRGDLALNQEPVALHMAGGVAGAGDGDIIGQILDIGGVGGPDEAHQAGLGLYLVPQLAHGILQQLNGGIDIAHIAHFHSGGAGLYQGGAGQAHNAGGSGNGDLAIGHIGIAATGVAGHRLHRGGQQGALGAGAGGGAQAGVSAVGTPDGGEIRVGQGVVHIPVPLLGDVGPHTVPEGVVFAAAAGVVAAVPDLLLGADAGVVTPNQEVGTAQIGSGHILHILGVVAVLGDIGGIPLVPDILFVGVVECPLAVVHTSGVRAGAGLPQGVVGAGLDTVVDNSTFVHIVAHRLGMVAGGGGAGVEGGIPVLNLDVVSELVVGGTISGAAQKVVVHPHGVALGVEQGVQLVDIVNKLREAPGIAVAGGQIGGAELHLVGAHAHVGGAGILLEEVGDIDVQLENEGLGQVTGDIHGGVVRPLQVGGPIPGVGVVDDTVHIRGIVGLLIVSGIEGVAGIAVVVLLKGPGQVIQVGGAVEAGNDLNMVLGSGLQDLHHLGGGQILTLVRVGLVGSQGPGGIVAAADPGKIVLRLEIAGVEGLIPQVEAEAGVIGEVELQGVVTHPGHFTDEVADPVLGVVFPAAIQADSPLAHGVGSIGGGEALDGVGACVAQVLLDHVGAVDQAVHITGGDLSRGSHVQLVALGGNAGGSIQPDDDVPIGDPAFGAPDQLDIVAVGYILAVDQLHRLEQLAGGLRIRHHEHTTVVRQGEGGAVGGIAIDDLAHGGGIRRGGHREGRNQSDHEDQQQDHRDGTSYSLAHNQFPFLSIMAKSAHSDSLSIIFYHTRNLITR